MGCGLVHVSKGFLARFEHATCFLKHVRHLQGRVAGNRIAIVKLRGSLRSKRHGYKLISKKPLSFDRGYRILLEDLVCRSPKINEHCNLFARMMRQYYVAHGTAMHSTDLHNGSLS